MIYCDQKMPGYVLDLTHWGLNEMNDILDTFSWITNV